MFTMDVKQQYNNITTIHDVHIFSLEELVLRVSEELGDSPAGARRWNDVALTSMRRNDVALTLVRRRYGVVCLLEDVQQSKCPASSLPLRRCQLKLS